VIEIVIHTAVPLESLTVRMSATVIEIEIVIGTEVVGPVMIWVLRHVIGMDILAAIIATVHFRVGGGMIHMVVVPRIEVVVDIAVKTEIILEEVDLAEEDIVVGKMKFNFNRHRRNENGWKSVVGNVSHVNHFLMYLPLLNNWPWKLLLLCTRNITKIK